MNLFPGSSNLNLAKKISKLGNLTLGDTILNWFPNQELKVKVGETTKASLILQSFSNPVNDHIIEYALLVDAIKRQGTSDITGIIPWFGYSKQDKVFTSGEPLSVKVIAKIIQSTPTDRIITLDLHNPSIIGYFDIPLINLSAYPLFISHLEKHHDLKHTIAISPDAGSVKSTTKTAELLGLEVAYINKKRDLKTGEVTIKDIDRSIDNLHAIIFDDMIATGSTIISTAEFLKHKGAKSITVCATHHLFIPGVQDKLEKAPISQIITTDSIKAPTALDTSKLLVLSVAPILTQAIQKYS
jgi:ribose-phosphate pyrophosphokinase